MGKETVIDQMNCYRDHLGFLYSQAVFVLKFLESYSYFAVSQILVIYLHTEFGVSDITAV